MGFPIGNEGIEDSSHQVETSEVNLAVLLAPICLFLNLKLLVLQSTMPTSNLQKKKKKIIPEKVIPRFLRKVTSIEKFESYQGSVGSLFSVENLLWIDFHSLHGGKTASTEELDVGLLYSRESWILIL